MPCLPESMTIEPGESPEVRVQVKNTGTAPAYWLHLQPSTSDDGAIRLIPPNRLFTGKGPQEWKHDAYCQARTGRGGNARRPHCRQYDATGSLSRILYAPVGVNGGFRQWH